MKSCETFDVIFRRFDFQKPFNGVVVQKRFP